MAYVKKMVIHGFKSFAKKTEINFDQGINCVLGPNGSGKSCSYDTVVTLIDGEEIKLGDLVEREIEKSEKQEKLDDGIYVRGSGETRVLSLNKETMKVEPRIVSKFIKREGDPLFRIRTRSGREIEATACHPIMSYGDGAVSSMKIGEMQEGFMIATPRKVKIESSEEDEDFARFMGYIIGDGYIARDRIEFVNQDPEVLEDYESLALKYSKWGIRKRVSGETVRIYLRDIELYDKIRELYPEIKSKSITSKEKVVPNEILGLGDKSIANLLAGLYDTDGSVRKDLGVIEFCTKNKNLARQVQFLLLRLGILSKVKKRISRASNTEKKIERNYYYVYIYGRENLERFDKKINLRVSHKRENLRKNLKKEVVSNSNNDVLPREVNKEIKKVVKLLGIRIKKIRKEYPLLAAYVEDRCCSTRSGVSRILRLFESKLVDLNYQYAKILTSDQLDLVRFMDSMSLSSKKVSEGIGLSGTVIRNQWATSKFVAREENLERFRVYLEKTFISRVFEISRILTLLRNLSDSEIYWDEVVSIKNVGKPEYVYDVTVEGNHNFIANNIFAHNSNISDALCFVLGRLSVKSMRAAKAKNLIFMGSKYVKPAKEAVVELIFDNSDRAFGMDSDEIHLTRIVRRNGQGVYKINGATKTRTEIIELLALAGIDPHGFNIVLQGQIQSIVKMHPDERRKIVEEVAGIAIYESRKEKSLKELEKTDQRLKEISTVLRERTSYLKNLEKEKAQAEKFRDLEKTVKRAKASILSKKKEVKDKERKSIDESIDNKSKEREKGREKTEGLSTEIEKVSDKVNEINRHIQKATGLEQENLHNSIANLKAEIEGLKVRKESYENRKREIERRVSEMEKGIPSIKEEISKLKEESPLVAKKSEEMKTKKEQLAEIERERKKLLAVRTEVNSLKERVKDKENQKSRVSAESEYILKQLESLGEMLKFDSEEGCQKDLESKRKELGEKREKVEEIDEEILEDERTLVVSQSEIKRSEEIKSKILDIDTCPLCQSKMTDEHVNHVNKESDDKIGKAKESLEKATENLEKNRKLKVELRDKISVLEKEISERDIEIERHKNIEEKKEKMKELVEQEKVLDKEAKEMDSRRKSLEEKITDLREIEERYETVMHDLEEISARTVEDVDTVLLYKERELEKQKSIIERSKEDFEEVEQNIGELTENLEDKESKLKKKEKQEEELNEKFKKMFAERDDLQRRIQEKNMELNEKQGESRQLEEQINYLKIGKAKLDAESESLEMELEEFSGVELMSGSITHLEDRLRRSQEVLQTIGSINMRALEVYEEVKEEYDKVYGKVETLEKEKGEIMKIIEEIDKKKKRSFMRTFKAINELFTANFTKLSTKGGTAYLEVENKEDLFAGGLNIVVKLAKGKYFDVTSLSGGEQTLVALSLLFAIQEHKPYHFYIFDEIDAALDKRNSERLANLLQQYMKQGQYIVVTHNDAIILESNLLYGVSMHDGVSKILSLKVDEENSESAENGQEEAPKAKS